MTSFLVLAGGALPVWRGAVFVVVVGPDAPDEAFLLLKSYYFNG